LFGKKGFASVLAEQTTADSSADVLIILIALGIKTFNPPRLNSIIYAAVSYNYDTTLSTQVSEELWYAIRH